MRRLHFDSVSKEGEGRGGGSGEEGFLGYSKHLFPCKPGLIFSYLISFTFVLFTQLELFLYIFLCVCSVFRSSIPQFHFELFRMKARRDLHHLSSNESVTWQAAVRYLKNVEFREEVGKTSRVVEKQERQIEALQSQVEEIVTGRFTRIKVGGIKIYSLTFNVIFRFSQG